jgi:amino acid adenylation domain-containing protein
MHGVHYLLTHIKDFKERCFWGQTYPSAPVILVEAILIAAIFLMYNYLRCDARMWNWRLQPAAAEIIASHSHSEEPLESEQRLLHARFVRHATATPNAPALIYGDGKFSMSYKELQHAALQTTFLLVDRASVRPCSRTPIGISAEGENFYKAVLGVVQTGNPYVPLTTAWPVKQLEHILADANIPIVLVDQDALTEVWAGLNRKEVLNIKETEKIPVRTVSWTVKEDDLAYILYTSGSTGFPKGVLAPHRCYYTRLKWMWSDLQIEPGEVGIHKTVPIWVDHIQEVFGYLGGGIPVVIASPAARKNPDMLNTLCRDHKVSRIVVVPSLLRLFMSMHGARLGQELPYLRTWITSGEPLTTEALKTFLSYAPGAKLVNTYGSTEVAGDITWAAYDSNSSLPPGEFVPIGKEMPGVRLHIVNPETLQPVQDVGELVVEGDFVAEGYHKRPEDQEKSFIKIPHLNVEKAFRTGDFGQRLADGNLQYHGRQDQQVKVHGQRVEVLHVEQVLKTSLQRCLQKAGKADGQMPLAVIMAVKSKVDTGSYDLHAFIETKEADSAIARVNIEEVKEMMQLELMPAHVPESFWKEPELPRLPNSKLDRKGLREIAEKKAPEQEFSKEVDSFGMMRKIAVEYADSRRAVNLCNIWCLYHVVVMHIIIGWFASGVVANVPEWARAIAGYWDSFEDVWMIMVGMGFLHGMGGEEKNKVSLLEPAVLAIWFFSHWILPRIINNVGEILTGIRLYDCGYGQTKPTAGTTDTFYCPSAAHLYFLNLLFWARMLVVTWHFLVTSRIPKALEDVSNGVLIALSIPFVLLGWVYPMPDPILKVYFSWAGTTMYITLYLVSFYFGYRILPKRESIKGPWQVVCPTLLVAHFVGMYVLTQLTIFPPFYGHGDHFSKVTGIFANAIPFACLFLCFLKLPETFDIRISGVALLCVYILHYMLKNWWLRGISIHGLKVFPSLPDLIYSAGAVVATTKEEVDSNVFKGAAAGMLQLIVLNLYIAGMFAITPYVLAPFSYMFQVAMMKWRSLVGPGSSSIPTGTIPLLIVIVLMVVYSYQLEMTDEIQKKIIQRMVHSTTPRP